MRVERPLFADVPVPPDTVPYEAYHSHGAFSVGTGVRSATAILPGEGHFGEAEGFEPEETAAILALAPGETWAGGDWYPWFRVRRLVPGTLTGWSFGEPLFADRFAEENADFDGDVRLYEELRTGDAIDPDAGEIALTRVVSDEYVAGTYSPETAGLIACLGDGETWLSEDRSVSVRRIR